MFKNVFRISILIVNLMFVFSLNSYASRRWNQETFASVGISRINRTFEHRIGSFKSSVWDISGERSTTEITIRGGRPTSPYSAVYLRTLISSSFSGEQLALGLMLRPTSHSTLFLFADVGVISTGGPYAVSIGAGFDISALSFDISALEGWGDDGETKAAIITLSYLF